MPSGGHRTDLTDKVAARSQDLSYRRGHTSRNVWSALSYGLGGQDGGDGETFAAALGWTTCLFAARRSRRAWGARVRGRGGGASGGSSCGRLCYRGGRCRRASSASRVAARGPERRDGEFLVGSGFRGRGRGGIGNRCLLAGARGSWRAACPVSGPVS